MQERANGKQILLYQTKDGQFNVDVVLHDETVWLTPEANGRFIWCRTQCGY